MTIIENLEISFRAFLTISIFSRFSRKDFEQPKNGHGPTMSKNSLSKKVLGKKVFLFSSPGVKYSIIIVLFIIHDDLYIINIVAQK